MTSYSLIQTLYMLFPCTNENEMENYVHILYKMENMDSIYTYTLYDMCREGGMESF